jgi:hypothetical protein
MTCASFRYPMPEPTLFCSPPPGATDLQKLALYSHLGGMGVSAAAAAVTLARSTLKGVPSHVAMGLGLGLTASASFTGQCLYANFIYGETARPAMETRLFLMMVASGLVTAGIGLVPGFSHKRGDWLRAAIPGLAAGGFAIAGVGRLPAVGGAGVALGALGGLMVAAAGGLHLFDKATEEGKNPQERLGSSAGFALAVSGLLVTVAAGISGTDGGADKSALSLSIAEAAFSLFILLGVLSVAGKPSDFPKAAKPEKKKAAPVHVPSAAAVPAPGYVPPPPPGGGLPPPPPGGPRPPAPGGAPRPPGR